MSQTATSVGSLWAGLTEVRVIDATARTATVASPDGSRIEARVAVPGYQPRAGDRVVIGAGPDGAWVLGVTHALRPVDPGAAPLPLSVTQSPDGVEVRDAQDHLLFRRAPDGTTVVSIGAGDLELRAPHGVLRLSGRAIELDAVRTLTLGVADSSVDVTPQTVAVRAPTLDVHAERGVARFEHAELVSGAIDVVAKVARHRIERLETRAKKIIERAVETYREVDDLALTKAGRVRTLVDDAYMLVARYAKLRAKEDVSIDGEQIRLG